jgi:hypothetical protein
MTRSLTIPLTISRRRAPHAAESAPGVTAMESDVVTIWAHRSRHPINQEQLYVSSALLETKPVNAPTALPADAPLSPDAATLSVVDSGGKTVGGFAVDGGTVTDLPDSPTPGRVGAQPIGVLVA